MAHTFRFFRAGGSSYQVSLERGDDIAALAELDQKLWLALSCPVHGLELDSKTLALIDTDGDSRIRPPELLAAVAWMKKVLHDLDGLVKRKGKLALERIDDEDDEGKVLLASAKSILANLDKPEAKSITLEDVLDTARIFAQTKFNGDGIVPAESADDAFVRGIIVDIIDRLGAETDRSGKPGVSRTKTKTFFDDSAALAAWWSAGDADKNIFPLGEATAAASDALSAIDAKLEDFFVRCRLAAFDARASLERSDAEWTAIGSELLSPASATLIALPVAKPRAGADATLPLTAGVNPAWTSAMRAFKAATVVPLIGERTSLTDADLERIRTALAPYRAHVAKKPVTPLDTLARARIEEIAKSTAHAAIDALVDQDEAVRAEAEAIASVERLLRYNRDLHTLVCNFINFRDFYTTGDAVFQGGTLYLDERSCDLCVRVTAAGAHAEIAASSNTFLVYCDCTRRTSSTAPPETCTIVAALTAGNEERIHAGRNAVFYDRQGRDWDATVTKIVKQPISIREAFWLPYRRIGEFIGEQIEKFAGEHQKNVHESVKGTVDDQAKVVAVEAPPPEKTFDVARFAGILAAVGLAIGAIGSALAVVLTSFFGLHWWQMPFALAGVMLAISGPSMLIAYMKLRKRMLGPILDGAGWAVNGEARINIAFGTSLTSCGELPDDAERIRGDLYADKKRGWIGWLVVAFVIAAGALWELGYLRPWLVALLKVSKH